MIVRSSRGMGQSRTSLSLPWEGAPARSDCAIGPPGGVVVIDAGDGSGDKIAAQLDSRGCVQSMGQVSPGASSSTSAILQQVSDFVTEYKALIVSGFVLFGVLAISGGGGRRR